MTVLILQFAYLGGLLDYVQAIARLRQILLLYTQKVKLFLQCDVFIEHLVIELLLLGKLFLHFGHLPL